MFSFAPPKQRSDALTITGHLKVLALVAGSAFFTFLPLYIVVRDLASGEVYGKQGRHLPYKLLATAANNPFEFYKTITTFAAIAAGFGIIFALKLAGYVYRIKLEQWLSKKNVTKGERRVPLLRIYTSLKSSYRHL